MFVLGGGGTKMQAVTRFDWECESFQIYWRSERLQDSNHVSCTPITHYDFFIFSNKDFSRVEDIYAFITSLGWSMNFTTTKPSKVPQCCCLFFCFSTKMLIKCEWWSNNAARIGAGCAQRQLSYLLPFQPWDGTIRLFGPIDSLRPGCPSLIHHPYIHMSPCQLQPLTCGPKM